MRIKLAVIFSFVFITVLSINAAANDKSGVSEEKNVEVLANDLKLSEESAKNANPKDIERSMQISTEGMAFVEYLRCCSKALPIPHSGRKQFWSKHIAGCSVWRIHWRIDWLLFPEIG
jgi:hypothetical protein